MPPKPPLQHLHLPGLTPYPTAQALQARLVRLQLAHKASPATTTPPRATILTFTPPPVYTTGRRELPASYPPALVAALRAPLDPGGAPAAFTPASRGGLITFHGPGQLVIYPTLSLTSPPSFAAPLSPRCYVSLLEGVTISTLRRFGVAGFRTGDPGVWVNSRNSNSSTKREEEATEEKKIAALGVHLRRNVTSYGVGLNVAPDLRWFDRIVACGIEGKGVTSLEAEGVEGRTLEEVAGVWVREFAGVVGAEVRGVGEKEMLGQLGVESWESLEAEGREAEEIGA